MAGVLRKTETIARKGNSQHLINVQSENGIANFQINVTAGDNYATIEINATADGELTILTKGNAKILKSQDDNVVKIMNYTGDDMNFLFQKIFIHAVKELILSGKNDISIQAWNKLQMMAKTLNMMANIFNLQGTTQFNVNSPLINLDTGGGGILGVAAEGDAVQVNPTTGTGIILPNFRRVKVSKI